jgi:hypothetical protein
VTVPNQENIEARLSDYIEGDLDEAGRLEIEKHLQAHPHHRKLIAELAANRDMLRQLPRIGAPLEILEAVEAHMERNQLLGARGESDRLAGMAKRSRLPRMLAAAAVVTLTAGLGAVVYVVLKPTYRSPQFVEAPMAAAPATEQVLVDAAPTDAPLAGASADASPTSTPSDAEASAQSLAPTDTLRQRAFALAAPITPASPTGQPAGAEAVEAEPACVLVISSDNPAATGGRVVQSLLDNNISFTAAAGLKMPANGVDDIAVTTPMTQPAAIADRDKDQIASTQPVTHVAAAAVRIHSQYTAAKLNPAQISSILSSLVAQKQSDQLTVYNAPPQVRDALASIGGGVVAPSGPTDSSMLPTDGDDDAQSQVTPGPQTANGMQAPTAAQAAQANSNVMPAPQAMAISNAMARNGTAAAANAPSTAPSGRLEATAGNTPLADDAATAKNAAAPNNAAGSPIRIGDVLSINLADVANLNGVPPVQTMKVAGDGTISLPQIGAVQAAGRTTDALSDAIGSAYIAVDPSHTGEVIVDERPAVMLQAAAKLVIPATQPTALPMASRQIAAASPASPTAAPSVSTTQPMAASQVPATQPIVKSMQALDQKSDAAGQNSASADVPRDLVIVVEQASVPSTQPVAP